MTEPRPRCACTSSVPPEQVNLVVELLREFPSLRYVGQLKFGANSIPVYQPDELAKLPAPPPAERPIGDEPLLDLDQIGALVRRSKRTMRSYRKKMPPPTIPGAGSIPHLWAWCDIRPWLVTTFNVPRLPERLPKHLG